MVNFYQLVTQSQSGIYAIFNINKILMMYRLPMAFYYFKRDVLKPVGITLNVCYFLPITIIFLLSFTCAIIACGTQVDVTRTKNILTPKNNSIVWLLSNLPEYMFDTKQPISIFSTTLYYTASNAMQLGSHDILISTSAEILIVIIICLSGYMIFTYVLVIIANSQTIINSELTLYQSHTKHIIKFMKMEKVPKNVQREAIQYYEYSWKQMHGLHINDVLTKCHSVLCEDFLYDQYKNTFDKVTIFQYLDSTIYRELSRELTRIYMLPNVEFIKLNNIVSSMYIVHSGRIYVCGPHGRLYVILQSGSVFGCLDNVPNIRSMVSFTSSGSVDLLEIDAKRFYKIMIGPVIHELQKNMLLTNMSYVVGRNIKHALEYVPMQDASMERKQSSKSKILNGLGMAMTFLFVSCASIISMTYVTTFFPMGIAKYFVIYLFDLLHGIFLAIKLFTPYHDSKGQLITDYKLIRKRLVKQPIFYLNLLAIIPVDAIFLIDMNLQHQVYVYRALLLTRLLRFYNITSFFKKFNDILNSDLLIMKLLSIIVYTTLLLHVETCIIFTVATRGTREFAKDMWAYQPDNNGSTELICGNQYICAFYFATSVLTFSGYAIYPRTLMGISCAIVITIFSKFIMSIAVAKLSACIQNYGADLARFDEIFSEMKSFLRRSAVSEYLVKCVVYYCEQLWIRSKGVQEPYLLVNAPPYLKEQIKIAAFGKHIYNNVLFANAHPDFLRHLIQMIHLQIFFKNDTICEQGDINETMYFVHSGTIDVLYSNETEEIKVDEIQELDCFGVIQGLYERTPHTHTFRASSVSVLCTLSLKDWSHILDFYPASKFEIYETLYNMPE
ncbi:potassium/sodium hyperpolarization-activated cyclic nucleotide-gated channel 4-like [Atheta coriaria]|uniref:potassium/sodium hyperpolarization-activated cyclic nucleotide-gated channel 4-like n=1 Tax=Dalotia coriaria TaxID=877792 RepID=UPI0031F369F5